MNKKAIIKKNDNDTYKIIDSNGNDYIIHYKIGETEYKNEFMKNLSWGDIQDIISMYHIEFINYDEIKEENKYVPNDVFQFRLNLKRDLGEFEIPIYIKPFPQPWDKDYDKSKYISPENQEQIVQDKYFTQRKIDELKLKLIQRIQECKNPFDIFCYDTDGGYNITEKELFNLD